MDFCGRFSPSVDSKLKTEKLSTLKNMQKIAAVSMRSFLQVVHDKQVTKKSMGI